MRQNCVASNQRYRYRCRESLGGNEDNYCINGIYKETCSLNRAFAEDAKSRRRYLFAVCDGMGGEDKGELASLIAVHNLAQYEGTDFDIKADECFNLANSAICNEIKKIHGRRIGSTAVIYTFAKTKCKFSMLGTAERICAETRI